MPLVYLFVLFSVIGLRGQQIPFSEPNPCWEDTVPADPAHCLLLLDKAVFSIKSSQTAETKRQAEHQLKLLDFSRKRLERLAKAQEKASRLEQRSESRAVEAVNSSEIFCGSETSRQQLVILSDAHLRYSTWQAFNRVAVTNPYPFTVLISAVDPNRSKSGPQIQLPPGCTITLSRSVVPLVETNGSSAISYFYLAQALNAADGHGVARSPKYRLSSRHRSGHRTVSLWTVRFR